MGKKVQTLTTFLSILAGILLLGILTTASAQTNTKQGTTTPLLSYQSLSTHLRYASESKEEILNRTISISIHNVTLSKGLNIVANKGEFKLIYSSKFVPIDKKVSLTGKQITVKKALMSLLSNTGLSIKTTTRNQVIITDLQMVKAKLQVAQRDSVKGTVTSAKTGQPLLGASILVIGTPIGTTSDVNGHYSLTIPENADSLRFSYIGYKTKTVAINGRSVIDVQLQSKVGELQNVIITGITKRKRQTFTGAVSSYSGQKLRKIGTNNIISSLSILDPSFVIIPNNKFGDNPNKLPQIELRGKSSITQKRFRGRFQTNPNLPLFILDGFKTDLQTVINLDMNRIKSVTILKDAASTAMYGANAANGVVVIKTVDPNPGEMRVSYSLDLSFNRAKLGVYHLMNARQKLKYEKLAGYYSTENPKSQVKYDKYYNMRLKKVVRGVNTHWINIPVRTSLTRKHSLYIQGGSNIVRYGVGLNYQNIKGVMKGSGKKVWSGNFSLIYHKKSLNISNRILIRGNKATNSPYGSFKNFAQMPPYYRKRLKNGKIIKFLAWNPSVEKAQKRSGFEGMNIADRIIANPLYNAMLNGQDGSNSITIQDNLQAIWDITDNLRLKGQFAIKKSNKKAVLFISPKNTMFVTDPFSQRGIYKQTRINNFTYQGNLMLVYSKVIGKNILTGNLQASIHQTKNELSRFVATGFPAGSNGNPAFATRYKKGGIPGYAYRLYRRNGLLGSINYSYDQRYLLDATFRIDGSTAFGNKNLYSKFWAIGIGWNLQNESWFDFKKLNTLRLRANIGMLGNQNFGSVNSTSVYRFYNGSTLFGQAIHLGSVGNPGLKWQKTRQISVGIDLVMFNNRLSATFNAYQKYTDPMVVVLNLGSSTGITNYHTNVGNLTTQGLEADIRFSPIYNLANNVVWTIGVTGSMIRSEYGGLGNKLKSLNEHKIRNKGLFRYKDGFSPTDIWAVPSVGIDPISGRELFVTPSGKYTYVYDTDYIQAVGNTRPTILGAITSSVTYKDFGLMVALQYSYGGDILNRDVYNKVENITDGEILKNHDIRALTGRWKRPGDRARFKAIQSVSYTPISSRFVQENNYIVGSSLHLWYRNEGSKWLNKFGLRSFQFGIYLNDFFRVSTVKRERGINYPFAKSITASLSISF